MLKLLMGVVGCKDPGEPLRDVLRLPRFHSSLGVEEVEGFSPFGGPGRDLAKRRGIDLQSLLEAAAIAHLQTAELFLMPG